MAKRKRDETGPETWPFGREFGRLVEARMVAALMRLFDAQRDAVMSACKAKRPIDVWTHAVPLAVLRKEHDLRDNEILWFVESGLVAFRFETARAARGRSNGRAPRKTSAAREPRQKRRRSGDIGPPRTFRELASLILRPKTCFVISQRGLEIVASLQMALNRWLAGRAGGAQPAQNADEHPAEKPQWDAEAGELRICRGKTDCGLVRKVAERASRLRPLLDAAEASEWAARIANPEAAKFTDWKKRTRQLSHKLAELNQLQRERRVKFSCVDKGRAFTWEIVR